MNDILLTVGPLLAFLFFAIARGRLRGATAAGSPVRLQTWEHMVHVWQIFHPELAEGRAALEEIRKFLAAT
jgi:acetyl esterase/lipase